LLKFAPYNKHIKVNKKKNCDLDFKVKGQNQRSNIIFKNVMILFIFTWSIYGVNLSKIDQAVQDLLRNEIFDL